MKRRGLVAGVFVVAFFVSQAGCNIGIRDAFSAGVYDFVAATVTETLTAFNPLSLLIAMMTSMASGA